MKKYLYIFVSEMILLFAVRAYTAENKQDNGNTEQVIYYDYSLLSSKQTAFQFSIQPFSLFREETTVCGFNLILWLGAQRTVYGISIAGIDSMIDTLYGINAAGFLAFSRKNCGVSIAPVNLVQENYGIVLGIVNSFSSSHIGGPGVQIGIINESKNGLQFGLLNHNEDSLCPWLPILNFSFSKEEKTPGFSSDISQKK